ncbi:MAG: hypothetical protein U5L11_06450 [Arhodomonas sp.]|nr:hypothetical protein [Arhodomonas sp.]
MWHAIDLQTRLRELVPPARFMGVRVEYLGDDGVAVSAPIDANRRPCRHRLRRQPLQPGLSRRLGVAVRLYALPRPRAAAGACRGRYPVPPSRARRAARGARPSPTIRQLRCWSPCGGAVGRGAGW